MSSVHEKIMDAVVDARALLSLPHLVEKRPALCRVPPVPTPCAEAYALARGDLSLDGVTHLGGLSVHSLLIGLKENGISDGRAYGQNHRCLSAPTNGRTCSRGAKRHERGALVPVAQSQLGNFFAED